jgi:hypothetical protein
MAVSLKENNWFFVTDQTPCPNSLGTFLKFTEVAQKYGIVFFFGRSYALGLSKMGSATLWAIFSKTHLATVGSML